MLNEVSSFCRACKGYRVHCGDTQMFHVVPRHSLRSIINRFKIKWKNSGHIHETWHIHTEGYFQTNLSFLLFSSKFQLPHLTNIHDELLYWFLEWHWRQKPEKNHFYQFTVEIISVVPCLKALNSIENLHHLSETNRIENYECFQLVGFEILTKSAKMKKNVRKWPREKPWKWK